MGDRFLQSCLCKLAADRWDTWRSLRPSADFCFGHRAVHRRHVGLRACTQCRNIDPRARCQRAGRRLRGADVAGIAHACLSGQQGACTRVGRLGELQRTRFHHRADTWRLVCRHNRLAKHLYLIVPVCAAAVALAYVAIRESSEPRGRRLDLPGQGLAIVGLGAFAFAAIEGSHWGWTSPTIISIAGIAVLALSLFVWVEARTPGPLLPLEFLRRPVFSATIVIAGLMTFGMYALLFIMPLYFQTMRGASPLIAGLELLPMPISFFLVSQVVGYLNNQLGPRIVMTAGMTCMGVGALALTLINGNTSLFFIELALLIVGVGLGLNTAPVNGVAVAALPPERSGTASAVLNTSRMVGATLGVAILGAVFAAYAGQTPAAGEGFLSGLRAALAGSGIAELIGAAIAITFIRRDSLHPQT